MSDLSEYPKDQLRFMILPNKDLENLTYLLYQVSRCPVVSDWYRNVAKSVLDYIDGGGIDVNV